MSKEHTPGPWHWVNWGGEWSLASFATAARPVVLTQLTTREAGKHSPPDRVLAVGVIDEANNARVLAPLTPEHPDARLLAVAPELLEAVVKALDLFDRGDREAVNLPEIRDVLRAVVEKVKGV